MLEQASLFIPLLLLSGAAAGMLAGLLGVGGGIVIVPMLYHLFAALGLADAVAMPLAVGTSLSTIVMTSLSSVRAHVHRGGVDWALVIRWWPFIVLGVAIGMAVVDHVSGTMLKLLFGALLVVVALQMLMSSRHPLVLSAVLPTRAIQSVLAVGVGAWSTLLGIGGGTLTVPLLNLFSFPIHRAVASAAIFGFVISVPATAGYIVTGWGSVGLPPGSTGYVNWIAFAGLVPTTMLFAPLGAGLAYRLNVKRLKQAFALFLLVVGVKMLWL